VLLLNQNGKTPGMGKLLIADDSVALLEALKYVLGRNGYEVKTLNNADTIYKEIDEFQPDLLILDIFLGDEDGREICEQIRTISDLRILLFSAFPKYLENYKSYGADDFIEKPFELKDLMNKIESILRWQLVPSAVL
jgi:DNA-binding response OmpR family regulator